MVVGLALAAVQMGMALPTGFLFGVGYGTGVRIGYEQVYPLLFPKGARPTTTELAATMKGMNTVYDAIGGKDASRMGIAVGITNAGDILKNPDFQVLEQLESSSSGPTSSSSNRSRYGLDNQESSPQQVLSSEIEAFNTLTNSEIWTKVRSMSTGQILNSRTGTGQSSAWMEITGKVLAERAQSGFTSSSVTTSVKSTPRIPSPTVKKAISDAQTPEWIAFDKLMNYYLNQAVTTTRTIRNLKAAGSTNPQQVRNLSSNIIRHRKAISTLRSLSNKYRDPNNLIRKTALLLRSTLASSRFKI